MKNLKSIFLALVLICSFIGAQAKALDILNSINSTLNTIDKIEYTQQRIKNKKDKIQKYTQTQQKQTTTQQYQNQQYYYNNNTNNEESTYTQPTYAQPYSYGPAQVYSGAAKTIKDLPAGTIVIDPTAKWKYNYNPNYYGEQYVEAPVFWQIFANDHFAQNTTLLVSRYFIARYDYNHTAKGLTAWKDSDMRRFLRTTFYTNLSQAFRNSIVNVETESVDMNNKPYKVLDNVFLLSIVEWGLSDRKNNGKGIKYDYINRDYTSGDIKYYSSKNLLVLDDNQNMSYATRTINYPKATSAGYKEDVFTIRSGILDNTKYYYGFALYIRPAVNIKSDTPVSGPYTMPYFVDKQLTYYVLNL